MLANQEEFELSDSKHMDYRSLLAPNLAAFADLGSKFLVSLISFKIK